MAQLDPKDVTIAILTNMIRLIGAELVAGRHRDDVATFERAVRAKLATTPFPIDPCESTEAGLELATRCIEQALTEIRSQADDVKSAISEDNREDISIDDRVKPTLQ